MPRFVIILLVLLLLAGGLMYLLSASVEQVPQTVIEENVAGNAAN